MSGREGGGEWERKRGGEWKRKGGGEWERERKREKGEYPSHPEDSIYLFFFFLL